MQQEIKTERLTLRPYKIADAKDIYELYARDKEVTRYLTWHPHNNIQDTQTFVQGRIEAWDRGNDFTWAILADDDKLVGGIGLRICSFKADFGYVIGRPFWNNGYATEALRIIIAGARQSPQVQRVWGVCDIDNIASARVMEKSGMQKEGILKKWIIHPQISGIPRDCLCYSITK